MTDITSTEAGQRRIDRAALISIPVLIALIIGLLSAQRTLAAARVQIANQPGAVLYTAAFEGDMGDWATYAGRLSAQISAGTLVVAVDQVDAGAFSAALPVFTDFDLRVKTRMIAGPEDNALGVVFRLQTGDSGRVEDDRYYLFQISSDGYYRLVRVLDGVLDEVSTWIESPTVRIGFDIENSLRVVALGDRFRFFVNDQPVALCIPNNPEAESMYQMNTCVDGQMIEVWQDAAVTSGQIGLAAASTETGGGGVQIAFDDLVIGGVAADTMAE